VGLLNNEQRDYTDDLMPGESREIDFPLFTGQIVYKG
jgi:hypothetical protein